MNKFLLLLCLSSQIVFSSTLNLYEIKHNKEATKISSFSFYPLPTQYPQYKNESFDVFQSAEHLLVSQGSEQGFQLLSGKNNPVYKYKSPNCDTVLSRYSNELFLQCDRTVKVIDFLSNRVKRTIQIHKKGNISTSPDGYLYLTQHDYVRKNTIIFIKDIRTSNTAPWKRLLSTNKSLEVYCVPIVNHLSLMEISPGGTTKFFYLGKDSKLSFLGTIDFDKFYVGANVFYEGKAQPVFIRNKKIYVFSNNSLVQRDDFSHSSFDTIRITNNKIYGFKIIP